MNYNRTITIILLGAGLIGLGYLLYFLSPRLASAAPSLNNSHFTNSAEKKLKRNLPFLPIIPQVPEIPLIPLLPLLPLIPIPPILSDETAVMAWIYPGEPSCAAPLEYSALNSIDVLKPEYFIVNETGELVFLTEETSGCNGYSAANVADMKKYSKAQYVTIASSYAKSMDLFLQNSLQTDANIETLVAFVIENDITGVELDFEDFGGWSPDIYARYKSFITRLGGALHQNGKKLMIDGPAMSKKEEEGWFPWRYEDIASLPVDHVVIMAYDYQYDYGVGSPVAPIFWMKNVVEWTKARLPASVGLTVGIPSYGYRGVIGGSRMTILTYEQLKREPGFATATRDLESGELTWINGGNVYFFQDGKSMSLKRQAAKNLGVTSVSVWHLGGNPWFERE